MHRMNARAHQASHSRGGATPHTAPIISFKNRAGRREKTLAAKSELTKQRVSTPNAIHKTYSFTVIKKWQQQREQQYFFSRNSLRSSVAVVVGVAFVVTVIVWQNASYINYTCFLFTRSTEHGKTKQKLQSVASFVFLSRSPLCFFLFELVRRKPWITRAPHMHRV